MSGDRKAQNLIRPGASLYLIPPGDELSIVAVLMARYRLQLCFRFRSKSSLANENLPKTIWFFIFSSEEVGRSPFSYLSTPSPDFLVNDGACLDLFFPGLIFSAGYSFVLIIIFPFVHLSLGINFVSCSCR